MRSLTWPVWSLALACTAAIGHAAVTQQVSGDTNAYDGRSWDRDRRQRTGAPSSPPALQVFPMKLSSEFATLTRVTLAG